MQKSEYDVTIRSADNGLIVSVGCKTLVVVEDRIDEAMKDIKKLLTEGYQGQVEVRRKWLNERDPECIIEHSVGQGYTNTPPTTQPTCNADSSVDF